MNLGVTLLGVVLVAVGGFGVVRPRPVARLDEQLDAIGSTTALDRVEPADWKVRLTQAGAATIVLFGLVLVSEGLGA